MHIVAEPYCKRGSSTAEELLPAPALVELRAFFSPREVEYIAHVLTPGELRVVNDVRDALYIARIKRMPLHRLRRYDRLVPIDASEYSDIQVEWLKKEAWLLGTRLGRSPTSQELFIDFMNNHNGQRFRAYFAMKYPDRMRETGTTAPKPVPAIC